VTFGALVSVDPVTATLPVVPDSVHSGVPASCGAAVGHEAAAGVGSVVATGATDGLLAEAAIADVVDEDDEDVVSDPHPARVTANAAAQAASMADEDIREEFTVVHATRHYAVSVGSPATKSAKTTPLWFQNPLNGAG
jgi:hypothetical protein